MTVLAEIAICCLHGNLPVDVVKIIIDKFIDIACKIKINILPYCQLDSNTQIVHTDIIPFITAHRHLILDQVSRMKKNYSDFRISSAAINHDLSARLEIEKIINEIELDSDSE